MNAEAVGALGAHDEVAPPFQTAAPAAGVAAGPSFGQRVASELQGLNQQLLATQSDLQGLALGQTENLHQLMIRLEESRMALQLALQVRNRVLEAYQDVMRMQV
jgi:flagellar hook-basal body complex protein FliE